MRFRIYYGDGTTFAGSTEGDAWGAPAVDVQVICIESACDRGFDKVYGKDRKAYYCYRDGTWYCCDDAGYWDYMMMIPGPKKVLFGRTLARTEDFYKILERASREGLG